MAAAWPPGHGGRRRNGVNRQNVHLVKRSQSRGHGSDGERWKRCPGAWHFLLASTRSRKFSIASRVRIFSWSSVGSGVLGHGAAADESVPTETETPTTRSRKRRNLQACNFRGPPLCASLTRTARSRKRRRRRASCVGRAADGEGREAAWAGRQTEWVPPKQRVCLGTEAFRCSIDGDGPRACWAWYTLGV